jgi:serine/threonine-protein kinase
LIVARIVGWNLYTGAFMFLIYVAFEPFVRRRWPRVLTSWTRVLAGRLRDPVVGRDILLGALAGIAVVLLREAEFVISRWFGLAAPAPLTATLEGLAGWRQFASLAMFVHLEALSLALFWLLILLLLRIVLRRTDLAAVASVLVVLPLTTFAGDHLLLEVSLGVLVAALSVFMLRRFGLLSLVVEITVANALTRLPITLNSSEWYMERSVVVLLCLAGLIGYGFHTSLAGRPLLGRRLVDD